MKAKIHREPSFVCKDNVDRGAAFTMRFLNFLFKLNMKAQSNIKIQSCTYFSARWTR